MKACVIIPCFNHAGTVAKVAWEALAFCPVIIVDDGSTMPLPEMPGCTFIRLEHNSGKGAALRAGFRCARELGFTHAITMDSDGQHFAEDLPKFLAMMATQPDALVVGVRDFYSAGCPTHRRRSNAVSSFWFRVETGVKLGDTQCGFRCYPIALTQRIKARSGRYAFEMEIMVRSSWAGTPIVSVPVKCTYEPEQIRQSHFRPVRDLAHITLMNIRLVLQSWLVPLSLRVAWSEGRSPSFGKAAREFFSEHAEDPWPLSLAVGLGLFFGIVPVYGLQLLLALIVAHHLGLNKAITAVASNISIPPMIPFILFGSLMLGHWLFTGEIIALSPLDISKANVAKYFWEWFAGSLALAVIVSLFGMAISYIIAKLSNQTRTKE